MKTTHPKSQPQKIVNDWIQQDPDKAQAIARAVLNAYFVDNDEEEHPVQLNPEPNQDLQDLDEQIYTVVKEVRFIEEVF